MRVLLLVLLLALCANCAIGDDFGQRIKKVFGKIKTALNTTTLQRVHEKFKKFGEKLKAKLTLSPEQKARLQELLKKIVPIKKDHVQKDGDSIEEINTKKKIGEFLFQSDIVLTEEQANEIVDVDNSGNRTKRQAFRDGNYPRTIWSTGVNFFFDPSAGPDIQRIFKKGAALWQKDTCIDFRMDNRAPNRIRVFREDGCWSFVGNLNRQQDLSLGKGCETVAIAAHEIGHALGFFHTQSRHDRDDFIVFNPQNVKVILDPLPSSSVNGGITMMPRDPRYTETLGSPFISFYELLMLNAHYRCLERCDKATSAKCMMGGFPHPRDCSRCVCPSGYGGRLCNERPPGCGGTLEAKPQYQVLLDEVGDTKAGKQAREDMTTCTYWIKAPVGSRIEVKIADLSRGLAVDGCSYWGVEIKTHADQRLTGYRGCWGHIGIKVPRCSDNNVQQILRNSSQITVPYRWEWVYQRCSSNRFADDILLITPSIGQAERMLTEFDETCGCIGLQLNLQKTMFMRNGWVSDAPFTLNGTNISECTSYVYVGRELNMMNDLTPELGRRRREAWGAYKSIEDVVKKTRNTRLRGHLFNTTVLPALTYSSET
ncbi:hypothetical protein RB195_004362 [Necator americanus]|uniref:Metalloendopeptidase n=2 Tax=Necator americanus TaxID=51031 RepID=A0ABR1BHL1_NECAM